MSASAASADSAATEQPRDSGPPGPLGRGEHASHRPHPPVEGELADCGVVGERLPWHLTRGAEHGELDGQVEARALLAEPRGRKVDGDAPYRPLELGRGDPAPHPMLRLLAGAVNEPDDGEPRHAVLEMRLDFDAAGLEADQRMGDGAREHPLHGRVPGVTCQ